MTQENNIDRLLQKVEWIHQEADIYDGDTISFRDNGRIVSGIVKLSPKSIEVTLTSTTPVKTVKATLASEMPIIFTQHPYETSPASIAGKDRARRLLLKLYYSSEATT